MTGPKATEYLSCLCWCTHKTVKVPAKEIRQGKTRSCGANNCHGPDGDSTTSAGKTVKNSRVIAGSVGAGHDLLRPPSGASKTPQWY